MFLILHVFSGTALDDLLGVAGGGGASGGGGIVKVSHQLSERVKCLSCLFMVNDGFDGSPKEQWETRSGGRALG